MKNTLWVAAGAVVVAAAGAVGGYWYANTHAGMDESKTADAKQAATPITPGKRILYYHDPMFPQQKFDKPGKSPYMNMQLVPVYADDAGAAEGGAPGVRINAGTAQNLGLRTAEIQTGPIKQAFTAVGNIAFDEASIVVVQARTSGWVEALHVRSPGDVVRAGQPLASIFAPEWLAAQEEYLAVRRTASPDLAAAARARLAFLGIPESQIAAVEREGKAHARITLTAPQAGVVIELAAREAMSGAVAQFAREGMQVSPGMTLFKIASLAQVWVLAEIPEAHAALFAPGTKVEAQVAALPERVFQGHVAALLPDVNATTRTLKARIRLANPGGAMKPGMFANLRLAGESQREAVLAPTEAVIATGMRKVVIVAQADAGKDAGADTGARYIVRDVETGADSGDMTEIRKGLTPGERVVVSSQFLIDSEASLKSFTTRLGVQASAVAAREEHRAEGKIEAITGEAVTLSHGPVPSMKMGAMTMDYLVPKGGLPRNVKVGDAVTFRFAADAGGEFRLTQIAPMAPAKVGAKK